MSENKEKKVYRVAICETLRKVVTVEAGDEWEARQKVSDGWHNSEYILDGDDFEGAEFYTLGEASGETEKEVKTDG